MNAIRLVYDAVPDSLPVPPAMRHRRVEVVFLALDETPTPAEDTERPRDWPEGFVDRMAGTLPDLPDREPQGEHRARVPGSAKGRLTILKEDDEHLDDFADYMP